MGWTQNGGDNALAVWLRALADQTNLYIALATSATAPTADTDTLGDLTEIPVGNGYTPAGGFTLTQGVTDFPVVTLDNPNDIVGVQLKDIVWTASGGPIPSTGGARYAIFTGHNATASLREVYASFDLVSDRTVSDGQTLTLQNIELQLDVT